MELRLRELAEEGIQGQDIAAMLSSEFGEYFSPDSVFHKASRLGVALKGRAGAMEPSELGEDPFGEPSWLKHELKKAEEPERERPFRTVFLNLDEEVSESELAKRVRAAYMTLWCDYVSDVLRRDRCTSQQAKAALKKVPQWFKRWARVPTIRLWDPNSDKSKQSDVYVDQHPTEDRFSDRKTSPTSVAPASELRSEAELATSPGSAEPPPVEKCKRCGGKPIYDSVLEEYICESCGSILRFQSKS